MPSECPTCRAPEPHLHPQCGRTGEVQPCPDPFHTQLTAENTPEKIALMRRIREVLDSQSHESTHAEVCPDALTDFKREILTFVQAALLRRNWTDIPLVVLTIVQGTDTHSFQGTCGALWTRECPGFRQDMLEFCRDALTHYAANYTEPAAKTEPPRVLQ